MYDKSVMPLADHLRAQDACIIKAGNTAKSVEIDLACTKTNIPNDWSIFSYGFAQMFAQSFEPKHPNSPTAQRLGACVAGQYVQDIKRAGCVPMKLSAVTADDLFGGSDCLTKNKRSLDKKIEAIVSDCVDSLKLQPAQ